MKTYNQFLETPIGEEVDPKQQEKKTEKLKARILLQKLKVVRSGGSEDIVAGYEPEGEELKEYSPNVTYQAKGGKKSGKLGKSSVYSLKDKDESKKDFRKSHVKDVEDGYVGKGHKPTPGSLKKEEVVIEGKKKGGKEVPNCVKEGAAWTKKAGKNPEGGLNEKGRKSYERENPGSELKAPQPEGGSRKKSFCARMKGMRKRQKPSNNTGKDRLSLSLKKWKCNEEKISAFEFVKNKIEKEVGKSGYVSKDNPRKPQSAADKAKARAHQAKVDAENAAARAKDPSQGRYPKG